MQLRGESGEIIHEGEGIETRLAGVQLIRFMGVRSPRMIGSGQLVRVWTAQRGPSPPTAPAGSRESGLAPRGRAPGRPRSAGCVAQPPAPR